MANVGWIPQPTEDGSFTFFSEEFGETFHSCHGAKAEAFQKFAEATRLAQRTSQGRVRILDVCYGLGYNTAAALETIWEANSACRVEVIGLELDPSVPLAAIAPPLIETWSPQVQDALKAIAQDHTYQTPLLQASLLLGDARQTIQTVRQQNFQADAILFDPFSPRRCPQLWTVDFFQQIADCLAPEGTLATYSRSASVRAALLAAGFSIGTIPLTAPDAPTHEWAQGTVAQHDPTGLHPLSQMEQEHLHTRAAIPYRDPTLKGTADAILMHHTQEQQVSDRESTSSWRRRWRIT